MADQYKFHKLKKTPRDFSLYKKLVDLRLLMDYDPPKAKQKLTNWIKREEEDK